MHPEIRRKGSGICPKCGMKLIPEEKFNTSKEGNTYAPLYTIFTLLLLITIVLTIKDFQGNTFSFLKTLTYFMAGFFLIFSGFKFLDLKGFAEGYASYDLLAQKVFSYGYIYPFLELFLGLVYLTGIATRSVDVFEIILMCFSGVGVLQSMLQKKKFQCACLGTFLKVPLTTVTLIEDFGMAVLGILMVLFR